MGILFLELFIMFFSLGLKPSFIYPNELFGGVDKKINLRGFSQRSVFRKPVLLRLRFFMGSWGEVLYGNLTLLCFLFLFIRSQSSLDQSITSSWWEGRWAFPETSTFQSTWKDSTYACSPAKGASNRLEALFAFIIFIIMFN